MSSALKIRIFASSSAAITLAHSKEHSSLINSTELRLKDAKAEADKNLLHLYETIVNGMGCLICWILPVN